MPSDTVLKAELEALLRAEPKPLTSERALAVAIAYLDGKKAHGFRQWFDVNGDSLLRQINGA